jgi:hypothetical protein
VSNQRWTDEDIDDFSQLAHGYGMMMPLGDVKIMRDEYEAALAAANERIAALEASQDWEPVPVGEIIRLPAEEPDTNFHMVRGRVYHTFETPDGQRVVIALPDNVRLMRRRPQPEVQEDAPASHASPDCHRQ